VHSANVPPPSPEPGSSIAGNKENRAAEAKAGWPWALTTVSNKRFLTVYGLRETLLGVGEADHLCKEASDGRGHNERQEPGEKLLPTIAHAVLPSGAATKIAIWQV